MASFELLSRWRSETSIWMRFQPPGLGAIGHRLASAAAPGRLSSSRKPPREGNATPGTGRISTLKLSRST
jgi:hypothetical protein